MSDLCLVEPPPSLFSAARHHRGQRRGHLKSPEQGFCFPGLVFRQDLLLPAVPPSVHLASVCLALLPRNQPSSCAAQGGDWQVHVGSFLSPSLPASLAGGGGGVSKKQPVGTSPPGPSVCPGYWEPEKQLRPRRAVYCHSKLPRPFGGLSALWPPVCTPWQGEGRSSSWEGWAPF